MDSSFRAISCDISHACSCSISNLRVVALRVCKVRAGDGPDQLSTLTEGGLGSSSRPHTRGLPYQPRRTQPVTRPPTLGRNRMWCGAPVVRLQPDYRRAGAGSVSPITRRTAGRRPRPRNASCRAGHWRGAHRHMVGRPIQGRRRRRGVSSARQQPTHPPLPCHASLWPPTTSLSHRWPRYLSPCSPPPFSSGRALASFPQLFFHSTVCLSVSQLAVLIR